MTVRRFVSLGRDSVLGNRQIPPPVIRIEILAAVGNVPSQHVAEKAGAICEGILRQRLLLHGVAHDAVVFSILRPRAGDEAIG